MSKIINVFKNRFTRFYNKFFNNKICGINIWQRFCNLEINGIGNTIEIKSHISNNVKIIIYGNNHKLTIEEKVIFKKGVIWFEDNNCEIFIGSGTTIEEANLAVAENSTKLIIGKDCMFSKGIRITTTDSHSIISLETNKRTNYAKNVIIGNHVWIGYCVNVNKGVIVGDNSVIASHSLVTKSTNSNSIIAGIPAKVIKNNITWNRVRLP